MKHILALLILGITFSVFGQSAIAKKDSLQCSLRYPREARKNYIHGVVEIKVSFDSLCNMKGFEIIKSLGYGCDESAASLLPCFEQKVKKENHSNCSEVREKIFPVTFKLD